ncbi:MAG: HAD-IA family hydrolase [Armatimonadetes bacterium]|nr:HAD-IA family hydrolase [Armatimonadota bacterium]
MFEGVRAFLFDLDGTLVDTNIDFHRMRQETLALLGRYDIACEEIGHLDILTLIDRAAERLGSGEGRAESFRRDAEAVLVEVEMPFCRAARPIPGGTDLLEALKKRHIKIGIVTRNCRVGVEAIFGRVPLAHDVLLTRNDIARVKPDPEHLWAALKALEVPPGKAVMVGDHWMDVQAGRNAGTRTVGYLASDKPADFFARAEPEVTVRHLLDLIPLLPAAS